MNTRVTVMAFLFRLATILAISIIIPGVMTQSALAAAPNPWSEVGTLADSRNVHTATLLPDGKVLVAGGASSSGILAKAEIFDPATGMWRPSSPMNAAREYHTATLLPGGKVLVAGGWNSSTYYQSSAELYDPASGTWSPTGSMKTAREFHTATLLANGKVLVIGGINDSGAQTSAELYDSTSGTWSITTSLNAARYAHTATLLPDGEVLVAGGRDASNFLTSSELYDPTTGQWSKTGSMSSGRAYHTATLLPNGQVLAAGGTGSSEILQSAEIYNPGTGLWVSTSNMTDARSAHTAVLLPDGLVLVAGGSGTETDALASVESYDSATGQWNPAGSLNVARSNAAATLLASGRVLVSGGSGDDDAPLASTELYDPSLPAWNDAQSMTAVRHFHTATILPDGKVLVAGGQQGNKIYISSSEIFDPQTGQWNATGDLNTARGYHTATLLFDGKVLVAGGFGDSGVLASAELFDPATGTWSPTGSLHTARGYHTATLLPNGKVLVVGGFGATGGVLADSELYDPVKGIWTITDPMGTPRGHHTATLLANRKVLVTGGFFNTSYLASAELFDPLTETWSPTGPMNIARGYHAAILLPNGKLLVTGGFNGAYLQSAELYDSTTGAWVTTGSLQFARAYSMETLLPDGQVLVAGGSGGSGDSYIRATSELYNPASGTWSPSGMMSEPRLQPTGTLMPDGRVLVAGGYNGTGGYLASAEIFDVGLGFAAESRPVISSVPSSLTMGHSFTAIGSGFRGYGLTEASGGGNNNSATNYPLVQLRRLDNEQTLWLRETNFSDTSVATAAVTGISPGYVLATIFVNGIPSLSHPITLVEVPSNIVLSSTSTLEDYGTPVTFTAAVSPSSATGMVQFSADGAKLGAAVALSGSQEASFTTSTLTGGHHIITADYTGDDIYAPSTGDLSGGYTVNSILTSTTVTASIPFSQYGTEVTFTATLSSVAATGSVQYYINGSAFSAPVSLVNGHASLSTSSLPVGIYTVRADYSGDPVYSLSSGTLTGQFTVNPDPTTTLVTSSAASGDHGSPVTFTANVSPAGVTGSVQFNVDGSPLGDPVPLSSGEASFTSSALTTGVHAIRGDYSGNDIFAASSGDLSGGYNVIGLPTSTSVTSTAAVIDYGASVTFTTTVSPSDVTGTVQYYVDGTPFGNPVPLVTGQASLTTSTLPGGSHAIRGGYSGDDIYGSSTGDLLGGIMVNAITSTTTVTSTAAVINFGTSVTITAAVAPAGAAGTVQFKVDGTPFGAPVSLAGGQAGLTTSTLAVGSHTITADYNGSGAYLSSSGDLPGGITVNALSTITTVTSTAAISHLGAPVTFSASLAPTDATGTVQFFIDGNAAGEPVAVVGGKAAFTTSTLLVGMHTVHAEYSGDGVYASSAGDLTGGLKIDVANYLPIIYQ